MKDNDRQSMFFSSTLILCCILLHALQPLRATGDFDRAVETPASLTRTMSVPVSPGPSGAAQDVTTGFPITYRILKKSGVTVRILDEEGGILREFARGTQNPGKYRIIWDGRDDDGERIPRDAARVELSLETVDR